MFLLRKSAIEKENGIDDAPVVTLYHGTKPCNVMGLPVKVLIAILAGVVCILQFKDKVTTL